LDFSRKYRKYLITKVLWTFSLVYKS
jgi:hypothetical protein